MDQMYSDIVSKPLYQIICGLTQESRLDVALPLAVKDLLRLKLKESRERQLAFEQHYAMDFAAFKRAWDAGHVANAHTYEVERDYWEWEAAVTDEIRLQHKLESLL